MASRAYSSNVFINCPFDNDYNEIFKAVVFTVFDCGYVARCALEIDDSADVRIDKIYRIISECKFGIHDISRTEIDPKSKLPRFNMPLELGLFLGARRYGDNKQKGKKCLILDKEAYRYQSFLSDIAGQDIKTHKNNPEITISIIRNWLNDSSNRITIPGGNAIIQRYRLFQSDLPALCAKVHLTQHELTFNDFTTLVFAWLKTNAP